MKKILIILSAISLGLTSCSNFLDRAPMEELSDASFWKSVADAEQFTGDIYRWLPGYNSMDEDVYSDDCVHGIKWAEDNRKLGVYLATDGFANWDGSYTAIRKCNMAIEKVELVPNISQEEKDLIIAEARALRGYFYFGLIQTFGDVPYTDKTLSLSEMKLPRTPVAEVYKKAKADLEFAASKLPAKYPAAKYGRLTSGAALTILLDMQNYFASFPQTVSGMTYGFVNYAEAAATAEKIINSGTYSLWDEGNVVGNYAELFWEPSDACSEIIMCRPYKTAVSDSGLLGWETFPSIGWGGINPTQSLVDAFEDSEGAPISKSKIYNEKKPFENRDPRLNVAILGDGGYLKGWDMTIYTTPSRADGKSTAPTGVGTHGDATATGYYQRKWVDQTVSSAYANNWQGNKDNTIYRFAEVLLIYAEAKTEASPNISTEALGAVNRVRARVGQPLLQTEDPTKPTYVASKEELRQRIRNEYRVEFAVEGKRFWSVRRFRDNGKEIALKVLNEPILGMKWDPEAKLPYQGSNLTLRQTKYVEANIVYPIPQADIDINPKLKQNQGY